jgi:hypothetical protein
VIVKLLDLTITAAISTALTTEVVKLTAQPCSLTVQANFTYGSGGTSVDAYLQTSLDGGSTWCDIANFSFTTASARKIYNLKTNTAVTTAATPTDGTITANTSVDGILGVLFRVKYKSVGTYAGSTNLRVDVVTDQAA